jgi:hypothetical protein
MTATPDLITFKDILSVTPDPVISDLEERQKEYLADKLLDNTQSSKGLRITLDVSHAGRRINNRLYSIRGQQVGVASLTDPFKKPVLRHHRELTDPIGRFQGGFWNDLSSDSMSFFPNIKDFMRVREAYDSDDPAKMYRALKQANLLANPKWPGFSSLRGTIQVTDREAIVKFLNGLYLTFSASHHSDRHVCTVCGADWKKGDICDHKPGMLYDKELCMFVTGLFIVDELSVVNVPADQLSQVLSLEMQDTEDKSSCPCTEAFCMDLSSLLSTQSYYDFNLSETDMTKRKTEQPEETVVQPPAPQTPPTAREFVNALFLGGDQAKAMKDVLEGETFTEKRLLCQIHDGLHYQYDWELRYPSCENINTIRVPLEVYEVHGILHDTAMEKDFRGAFINGELDKYSKAGAETGEYLLATPEGDTTADSSKTKPLPDTASGVPGVAVEPQLAIPSQEELRTALIQDIISELAKKGLSIPDADCTDCEDKTLTTEGRKKMQSSTFCGPNRSYPVPDKSHAVNALARAKANASPALYAKIKACVCRKSSANGWDLPSCGGKDEGEVDPGEWTDELIKEAILKEAIIMAEQDPPKRLDATEAETLNRDLDAARTLAQSLKDRLMEVVLHFAERAKTLEGDAEAKLDAALQWFDTIKKETASSVLDNHVENPAGFDRSGTSSDNGEKRILVSSLGEFEQRVLRTFKDLAKDKGPEAAERWLNTQRRYLPRGFHPNNLQES